MDMAGSFQLELDTTGPSIEITAPNYVTTSTKTIVNVLASEELSEYQEFYTIDSQGERREVTLEHRGDTFQGVFYFTDYPAGIIQFYAKVKDKVYNPSPLRSTAINLITRRLIRLDIADFSGSVTSQVKARELVLQSLTKGVITAENTKGLNTFETTREIEVKTEDG